MDSDIYKTPESDLGDMAVAPAEFYAVAPKKFLILFISTLGLYRIYWFYKHWSVYQQRTKESIWPIPRAIFSIFYAQSLFNKIDLTLREKAITYRWSPGILAAMYVLFVLVESVCDRLSYRDIGSPTTDLLSLAVLPVILWTTYRVQLAANVACGDPDGESNKQFTAANIVWMLLGALLWLAVIAGMYMILSGIEP